MKALLSLVVLFIATGVLPAVASEPDSHRYVTSETRDGTPWYGYASNNSEVIWVSYQGKIDGKYVIHIREESTWAFHRIRCEPPCKTFVEDYFQLTGNRMPESKTYLMHPDMIAAHMFADAMGGKLKIAK